MARLPATTDLTCLRRKSRIRRSSSSSRALQKARQRAELRPILANSSRRRPRVTYPHPADRLVMLVSKPVLLTLFGSLNPSAPQDDLEIARFQDEPTNATGALANGEARRG
jgi:hypothetical protein